MSHYKVNVDHLVHLNVINFQHNAYTHILIIVESVTPNMLLQWPQQ
jgi:hypothetical protein